MTNLTCLSGLCNHLLCRVWPQDGKELFTGALISIFAINTWLLPYNNFGPNGPSWTISTLFFWYWCFPFILPRLQRLTDEELGYRIVRYFWLSIGITIMLLVCLGAFAGKGVGYTSISYRMKWQCQYNTLKLFLKLF